jgi:hypothetical protein
MFYALRNLFALIGYIVVVIAIVVAVKVAPMRQTFESFDKNAINVYSEMMRLVLETGDAAAAMVWKVEVNEGLTAADMEQTIRFAANEHSIKNVGEFPLSGQIEAMSGEKSRYLKIFMFCNVLTALQMLNYSDAYSAFFTLPHQYGRR